MTSSKILKFCAWCGVINMSTYFVGMIFADFLPVPGPSMSEAEVYEMFFDNRVGIQIGAVIMLLSGLFLVPLIGLISAYLKRIEGNMPVMTYGQLVSGTIGILFFYLPAVLFFVMAFRPERGADLIHLFYDFAWMFMIIAWPSFLFQNSCIGLGIFADKNSQPMFPRWLGYFQFWTALLYLGAMLGPFFKTGPFAWNGLFAFWVPAIVFFIWNFVMAFELVKVIERDQREGIPVSA